MIKIRESDSLGTWDCHFEYRPSWVVAIKKVGGAKFIPREKGGPYWRVPATMDTWNSINELFDKSDLEWDKAIRRWVMLRRRRSERLRRMAVAETAELEMLPELNPDLYEWVRTRGYQLADIAFMAEADHPLNTNEPGTGKTAETIATVYESGLDEGPVLVVAPATSLDTAWAPEVRRWVPQDVPVVTPGPPGPDRRLKVQEALSVALAGDPIWLIVNPEVVKRRRGSFPFPDFIKVQWNVVVLDEFHRMGLGNPQSEAAKSLKKLKADKRIALSGTPMGGKPIKLWSVLNFLYPEEFSSKWAFASNWLQIHDNGFGKEIGDVIADKREAFNEMMNEYSVRRRKIDVMQWLPPVQWVDRWVSLEGKQKEQYDEWDANAEIEIEEELLDAVSILAVYTRLRQFAMARQTVEYVDARNSAENPTFKLTPTEDSAKLPVLWEILDERGIPEADLADTSVEGVIVFSQFTQVIDMVEGWLLKQGVNCVKITGKVKGKDRTKAVNDFQAGKVHVMLMNTNAGGVAITLDRADTVVFLDQTWNPDDEEQAVGRAHRGSKDRQVMAYRILAKDTIDERVYSGNISKESINQRVLDRRHNP